MRLMIQNSINRQIVRVFQFRMRSFIKRIEIEKHKQFVLDVVQRRNSFFVQLITQITRIVDYFARHMNCTRRVNASQC